MFFFDPKAEAKSMMVSPEASQKSAEAILRDRPRREALMLLARYYMAKANLTFIELFSRMTSNERKSVHGEKAEKKDLANFLAKASLKGASSFFDFFEKETANAEYFSQSPAFVQKLIETVFDFRLDPRPSESSIAETMKEITADGGPYQDELINVYAGLWDVIRFSAHVSDDRLSSGDPRVMRAALQIFKPEVEGDLPKFELRSRPGGPFRAKEYNSGRGSVFVLGRGEHLQFFGWEQDTRYPLEMVASVRRYQNARETPRYFGGIMVRRHEQGHIFASRVLFVRSAATDIEQLSRDKIGMFRQSELCASFSEEHPEIESFDELMSMILNRVGADGQSGLWEPR